MDGGERDSKLISRQLLASGLTQSHYTGADTTHKKWGGPMCRTII